jgi:hypothetical protein
VAVQDAQGNTVNSNCLVTLSLTSKPNVPDSLLGTVSRTANAGLADFNGASLRISTTEGGTGYVLTATPQGPCGALAPAASNPFEITRSGVPFQLELIQAPSTAALNQVWSNQPIVRVLDVDGNLVGADSTTVVSVSIGAGSPGEP